MRSFLRLWVSNSSCSFRLSSFSASDKLAHIASSLAFLAASVASFSRFMAAKNSACRSSADKAPERNDGTGESGSWSGSDEGVPGLRAAKVGNGCEGNWQLATGERQLANVQTQTQTHTHMQTDKNLYLGEVAAPAGDPGLDSGTSTDSNSATSFNGSSMDGCSRNASSKQRLAPTRSPLRFKQRANRYCADPEAGWTEQEKRQEATKTGTSCTVNKNKNGLHAQKT